MEKEQGRYASLLDYSVKQHGDTHIGDEAFLKPRSCTLVVASVKPSASSPWLDPAWCVKLYV